MRIAPAVVASLLFLSLAAALSPKAASAEVLVSNAAAPGAVALKSGGATASIYTDANDVQPVGIAAELLSDDIQRVTGSQPAVVHRPELLGADAIIVGTLGHSRAIDQLVDNGKIDPSPLKGKWESYQLQVVSDPLPNVKQALVIVGSDRRGTAYGVVTLSKAIGVSPWYWWADVPVPHRDALFVLPGMTQEGPPAVKYRGIFLNDEAPAMSGWAAEKFGGFNSKMYVHVFELLLRLKANYLWPAMWGSAFNEDDPQNPKLANDYGIVMGTSHQEPMLRAQGEFDRRYPPQDWNYATHPELMQQFWREGVRRNKNDESIITLGMRGRNDTPMIEGATLQQSMDLLEKIVAEQRTILTQEVNPEITQIPQMWCLYKEVQSYYEHGLRVPDDVTLLWSDDNWGNLRRLPTPAERKRSGGAGIYYHFDYVGAPRDYKWINTNPIGKIWEQMNLANAYGATRIWIVNVGDLKPMELPIDFFLTMAWNPRQFNRANLPQYRQAWAAEQFGPEHAAQIAQLIDAYTTWNGRRKPELLDEPTYSPTSFDEADRMLADCQAAQSRAQQLAEQLPADQQDAYFELVGYPVEASAVANEIYILAAKNRLYAAQGRAATADLAQQVRDLFAQDAALSDDYNHKVAHGKWDHMMDQTHLGYTFWNEPPNNAMPGVSAVQLHQKPTLGVAVQGAASSWPGGEGVPLLRTFDSLSQPREWIDVFNRGTGWINFTAVPSAPWIIVDKPHGKVADQQRLWVTIDWNKAPANVARGSVQISTDAGGAPVTVHLKAFHPAEPTRADLKGFVETNGYVSIDADHFTDRTDGSTAKWAQIVDCGRVGSAMSLFPVTAASLTPPNDSPCLRYSMYLFDAGQVQVTATVSPTQAFVPGRGLRYAVSFDDQPPQVIDSLGPASRQDWAQSVSDECRQVVSEHTLEHPGYHTLKLWMVDPGIVLQKLLVSAGPVPPSYLGPPESYRGSH